MVVHAIIHFVVELFRCWRTNLAADVPADDSEARLPGLLLGAPAKNSGPSNVIEDRVRSRCTLGKHEAIGRHDRQVPQGGRTTREV